MLAAAALVGIVALFTGSEQRHDLTVSLGRGYGLPTAHLEAVVRRARLPEDIFVSHESVDVESFLARKQSDQAIRRYVSRLPLQHLSAWGHRLGAGDVVTDIRKSWTSRMGVKEASPFDIRLVGGGLTSVSKFDFHLGRARAVKVANYPSNNPDVGAKLKFGRNLGLPDSLLQPVVLVASYEEQQQGKERNKAAEDRIEPAIVRVEKPENGHEALWILGWFGLPVGALLLDRWGLRRGGWPRALARRIGVATFALWCGLTGLGPIAWGIWSAVR